MKHLISLATAVAGSLGLLTGMQAAPVDVGMVDVALSAPKVAAVGDSSRPRPDRWQVRGKHAVFVLTNNSAANSVVAYTPRRDGTLELAKEYPTGGQGANLNGAVLDKLASQGALTYDDRHDLLYAVNAGSDSVSVFDVRGATLTLRQTFASGGDFPVSVAVHRRLVYVLNAGGTGSVQGFQLRGQRVRELPFAHRDLQLKVVTDAMQFVNTPGQVAFTPDGSRLLVTRKANDSSIDVFRVLPGGTITASVRTAAATPVPFALDFDGNSRVVVTEAAMSVVTTYRLNRDNTLTRIGGVANGQVALCWILRVGNVWYGANTGGDGSKTNGSISSYRVDRAGVPTLGTTLSVTNQGTTDLAASHNGRTLYALSGDKGRVDSFSIGRDGTLTHTGDIEVPNGADLEGIVAI